MILDARARLYVVDKVRSLRIERSRRISPTANGETVTDLTFGAQDALTLDDIPRIVAAEQAKEQYRLVRVGSMRASRFPLDTPRW
jgi:hypothetical protein